MRLKNDGAQAFRSAIHGSRQAGRPSPNYGQVIHLRRWPGHDPVSSRDFREAGIMQDRTIVADQSRKTPRVNPEFLDQLLTRLGVRRIERDSSSAC